MLIRPTGNDRPDFLHSLGRLPPIALQHRFAAPRIPVGRRRTAGPDPERKLGAERLDGQLWEIERTTYGGQRLTHGHYRRTRENNSTRSRQ